MYWSVHWPPDISTRVPIRFLLTLSPLLLFIGPVHSHTWLSPIFTDFSDIPSIASTDFHRLPRCTSTTNIFHMLPRSLIFFRDLFQHHRSPCNISKRRLHIFAGFHVQTRIYIWSSVGRTKYFPTNPNCIRHARPGPNQRTGWFVGYEKSLGCCDLIVSVSLCLEIVLVAVLVHNKATIIPGYAKPTRYRLGWHMWGILYVAMLEKHCKSRCLERQLVAGLEILYVGPLLSKLAWDSMRTYSDDCDSTPLPYIVLLSSEAPIIWMEDSCTFMDVSATSMEAAGRLRPRKSLQ